jgi:tetratricopeptide (TPR) repeat protein/DNA-binding winged helix-turn-helix (wHTH) protein
MSGSGNSIYRLGDVVVDTTQGCLKRDGQEQYLRPKTFQVLVYLIEHRERLVTKEELMENLWPETAVTDDALVQCIVDIRKALGDDSRQPKFVKTLPKVGYRFISPVEELTLNGQAAVETEEVTSFEIEFEEVIEDSQESEGARELRSAGAGEQERLFAPLPLIPPAPLPLGSSAPLPASPSASVLARPPARRRVVFISALVVALTTLAVASVYVGQKLFGAKSPPAEVTLPQVPGKRPVAVMFFENRTANRELNWLREGLADMLITNLSRSKKLTVLSRQQLHQLLERIEHEPANVIRLNEAMEIARRCRAETIILGSFAQLGEKTRIDVQLHDGRSGQLQAAEHVIVDRPEHILTQIDLVSLKLAGHLGASFTEQDQPTRLADVMTSSLEAYRYYSLALEKAKAYHTNEAIELWKKAIALDPQFAMAYARIGYTHAMIRVNETSLGKPYLEKALQLAHRLTEKDKLYVMAWSAAATGNTEQVISSLRALIAQYPQEVEAYLRLGYQLNYQGKLEEATAVYQQGVTVAPEAKDIYNALGFALYNFGRYDEAIAAHERYVELAPNEPNAHDSLGMSYNEAGRYEEAIAEFDRALALNPEFHFAHLHLGDVSFRLGRYRTAIEQYQRYLKFAPSDWDRSVAYNRLAMVYFNKGDLTRAAAAAKHERKHGNDFGGSLLVALARGDWAAAQQLNEKLLGESPLNPATKLITQLGPKSLDYLRGYYALKTGRADEAIEHFKKIAGRPPLVWNVDGVEDCLANAYLELGRWDDAVAEYERLLRLNPNYPLAEYHLGQAYERKGRHDRARAAYERFLEIWRDADADIPEVIVAKKRLEFK